MKQVFVVVLLVIGIVSSAFCQPATSKNNYTGDWETVGSWVGGVAPPVSTPGPITITALSLDLTINGYITRTGDVSIADGTNGEDFIVNDTLVVIGDLHFGQNGADLVIGPNGVLIVIGTFSNENNHVVTNNGILVVTEMMDFPDNASETYGGTGEIFSPVAVDGNTAASNANIWSQLNKYPELETFVTCRMVDPMASCMLPIELSYFVAELQNDIVQLRWATIMEENFQKFIVQRASNGIDFQDIGEVAGKGFDIYDIESKYSFDDKNPLVGFNYYRLKAVDLDDTFEYFGVKAVKVSAPKTMAVYPNPSAGDFIVFSVNFNPSESDRIVLVDQLGVEVFNGQALISMNSISFNNKLRPGVYLLRYVANGFEQTTRILVTN